MNPGFFSGAMLTVETEETFPAMPCLPGRGHGGVKTPPYKPPNTVFCIFHFPAGCRGRVYAARGRWQRRHGFVNRPSVPGWPVGRGLDPAAFCFARRVLGNGEVPTLPSASQTPPLRGEALLYYPSKALLPGELDVPQAQTEGFCSPVPPACRNAAAASGQGEVPTLPSASQTPLLRGEALLYYPPKAPL